MQGLTCFIFIFLIDVLIIVFSRNMFHPAVLVATEWLIILGLYIFTDHGLFELSTKTYLIVFLWVAFFTFFACFFSHFNFAANRFIKTSTSNKSFIRKLYVPLLCSNIGLILSIVTTYGVNFSAIRYGLLGHIPINIKLLFYVNTFCYAYFAVILFSNIVSKKKIIVFAFSIIVCSLFKTNKTVFFSFFLLILFCLAEKQKLTLKVFAWLSGLTILLMAIIVIMRGDVKTYSDFTVIKYLSIYILSPLTAFDQVVKGNVSVPTHHTGGYLFSFFYKIFSVFTGEKVVGFGPWVNVPLPTNVFTVFAPSYIDFGVSGIVFMACIQGITWGVIFSFVKKEYLMYKVLYAVLLYYPGMQFFSDYFTNSFSVFIQYCFFSFIIVVKIKELKYFTYNPNILLNKK